MRFAGEKMGGGFASYLVDNNSTFDSGMMNKLNLEARSQERNAVTAAEAQVHGSGLKGVGEVAAAGYAAEATKAAGAAQGQASMFEGLAGMASGFAPALKGLGGGGGGVTSITPTQAFNAGTFMGSGW